MLYDLRELFRKGKLIDKRLYESLEDLYSKVENNTSSEESLVKIVEVPSSGSEPLVTEIKNAFGTTNKPFHGIVKDTTNNKTYFVVFNGSKCDKIEI